MPTRGYKFAKLNSIKALLVHVTSMLHYDIFKNGNISTVHLIWSVKKKSLSNIRMLVKNSKTLIEKKTGRQDLARNQDVKI